MLFIMEILMNTMGNDFPKTFNSSQFFCFCRLDLFQVIVKCLAEQFRITQTYMIDTKGINEVCQIHILCFFHRSNEIGIRLFTETIHFQNGVFMFFQTEQIGILIDKTFFQEFFQCFFGKPFHIHGISGNKVAQCLDTLCLTARIGTVQCFPISQAAHFRFTAAYEAMRRDFR